MPRRTLRVPLEVLRHQWAQEGPRVNPDFLGRLEQLMTTPPVVDVPQDRAVWVPVGQDDQGTFHVAGLKVVGVDEDLETQTVDVTVTTPGRMPHRILWVGWLPGADMPPLLRDTGLVVRL